MRRYNEKEVKEILRRTLAAGQPHGAGTEGVTLSELERVAEEMGFSPERVREAAEALDVKRTSPIRHLFGVPSRLEDDRVVQASISDAAWNQIVGRLRARYGVEGRTSNVGNAFEWRNVQEDGSKPESGETVVSSYPRETETRIHAETDLATPKLMALVLGVVTPAALILGLILPREAHAGVPPGGLALLAVVGILGPYAAMVGVMKAWHRHQQDRQRRAVDEIAELAAHMGAGGLAAPAAAQTEEGGSLQSRLGE